MIVHLPDPARFPKAVQSILNHWCTRDPLPFAHVLERIWLDAAAGDVRMMEILFRFAESSALDSERKVWVRRALWWVLRMNPRQVAGRIHHRNAYRRLFNVSACVRENLPAVVEAELFLEALSRIPECVAFSRILKRNLQVRSAGNRQTEFKVQFKPQGGCLPEIPDGIAPVAIRDVETSARLSG